MKWMIVASLLLSTAVVVPGPASAAECSGAPAEYVLCQAMETAETVGPFAVETTCGAIRATFAILAQYVGRPPGLWSCVA